MASLTLTVLGSSPSWPNPGSACSGYLVAAGATRVVLDCGPGVVGRLRAATDVRALRAVLISHMHPDHYLDLVVLRHSIKYGKVRDEPLDVYVPPGGTERLARLGEALDDNADFFAGALSLHEYEPTVPLELGDLTLSFRRVIHYVPAYAMRLEAGSTTLVFSGDSSPCDPLVEHARGADALLAEAAIERPDQDNPEPEKRGHMAPAETADVARRAGVGRLLITHSPIDPGDPERAAREAAAVFGGRVERVRDGERYDL